LDSPKSQLPTCSMEGNTEQPMLEVRNILNRFACNS
jgi:hypothetical protein